MKTEIIAFLLRRRREQSTFVRGVINGILHTYTKGKWVVASEINNINQ